MEKCSIRHILLWSYRSYRFYSSYSLKLLSHFYYLKKFMPGKTNKNRSIYEIYNRPIIEYFSRIIRLLPLNEREIQSDVRLRKLLFRVNKNRHICFFSTHLFQVEFYFGYHEMFVFKFNVYIWPYVCLCVCVYSRGIFKLFSTACFLLTSAKAHWIFL